ncbi:hypothetical protein ACQRIU_006791 [Beauveria bassiana]
MACQILLDFSSRSSSSSSSSSSLNLTGGAVGPEAPLGRTQTGAVRRRRWAPRARTGCLTCRTRRVKCDEERPICRRCASSRVTCRGYQTPSSPSQGKSRKNNTPVDSGGGGSRHHHMLQTPPESPPHHHRRSETTALLALGSVHQHHINIETEPPDWDLQEGIRYYFQVVLPGRSAEVRSGGHPEFHAKTFHNSRFISQVIGDQISRASKARGMLIQPGHHPAFAGVWTTYSRYLSSSITIVNQHIQDAGGGGGTEWRRVLYGIDQLLVLDIYVERSQWQAHLGAFFEYIRHRGGIAAMLDQPEPPYYCLNHVLAIAINVNTTSPARQQVHGFDDYADHQLVSILESAYSTSMQCPTELYIAMVHISRLRASLAQKQNGKLDKTKAVVVVEQQVRCIFASIARFDADDWAAGPEFKDKRDTVAKVGRIYAIAVRLYGIMTLPPSAVASCVGPASESGSGLGAEQPAATHGTLMRAQQRDELLALTRRSWDQLRHTTSLCWPLIVAGVALADGSPEDQDFIESSLLSIWSLPNTSACFITAIRKLRPFWNSGKTGWEDCFDTPLMCVV